MIGSSVSEPSRVAVGVCLLLLVFASPLGAAEDPGDIEKRLAGAVGADRIDLLLKAAEAQVLRAPDQTVKRAEEALEGATALGLKPQAAKAFATRATGLFYLGDLDRALEGFQQGLKAGEELKDPEMIGNCLNGVAVVALRRGQLEQALDSFRLAVAQLEAAGNREKLAGVASNIANIYYTKGEYGPALDQMSRALALYEALGNEKGQGVVLNSIGNVQGRLGNQARARETFERALKIGEKTGYPQLQIGALVNIAELHGKAKEWDAALDRYRQALALARTVGSKDSIVVCLNNVGDVLREKGDAAAALTNYQEAMRIAEEMNARPRQAVLHLNVGKLQLQSGKLVEAEASLRKAYDLGESAQERTLQKDSAEALVTVYERKGDFRRAFEFQGAAEALREKLFSKQNLDKVAALEAKVEAERKEGQILLLKKQQEIQSLEVKRQRLWIGAIATALILLAAVAALLLAGNRLKEKTNAELTIAYSRMEEQARSDALTSLANRRAATERLEQEVRRIERTNRPMSLLMLDVDDFKKINDERGHACGDAVLKGLGVLLKSMLRELDLAARWGGEEFLLVLAETSPEGALQLAEKIRRGAEEIRVFDEGKAVSFTVTIGVATFSERLPIAEYLRRVDAALYEGKRAGKNRVVAG